MKHVAILTAYQKDYVKYDFYFESEQTMQKILNDNGIRLHYVSPHYYDEDKKVFTQHVTIGANDMHIIDEEYKPDLLRVRMGQALYHCDEMFAEADFITVPTMRLKHIDSDKYQMYRYLEDYQPHTSLLGTYYFYDWLQEKFGHRVVVKPISGCGGTGIEFYDKAQLRSNEVYNKYSGVSGLHIVQDFKNFSGGAPGIAEANHDLRVVFMGDYPTFSVVRVPKSGSLKSNVAGGGRQYSLPIQEIPEEVMYLCKQAHIALKIKQQDMYSLDFAYVADEGRRYLIEMNSSPGIRFPEDDIQYQYDYFQDCADYFHLLMDPSNLEVKTELDYNTGGSAFLDRHLQQEFDKALLKESQTNR